MVPPAGFALILDPSYEGFYGAFPEGTVLLTVGNATLGNGLSNNDPITLREPEGRRIDTYSFPRNAGNGVSVEKRDVLGGDSEENWAPAPCGNSPGRSSCLLDPPLDPAAIPIVITEVMSNPLTEPSGEFIEIFNTSEDTPFELRNVRLTDGDSTDVLLPYLGGPTAVPPQSFALIIDPDYDNNYPIPDGVVTVTVDGITLGNGLATSDPITLLSPNGDVVLDGFGHPFDAGNGRSIEKVDVPLGDLVVNWIPSPCESGSSPGLPNCAFEFELDLNYAVMITEIMANPLDEDTGEYVEIWNYGNAEVDIATLEIGDGDVIDQIQAFDEGGTTMLQPGQYGLILDSEYNGVYGVPDDVLLLTTDDTTVGSGLQNNDPIFIRGPDGRLLDAYSIPFNAGNGYSVEKADLLVGDVQANWRRSPCRHSAGRLNCAITGQAPRLSRVQLVISEVLANAAVERTGEFVEVFNAGVEDVDLDDLLITDGDATDELEPWMEGATVLSPGEFGLIIDRNYDGDFEIPDDVVVVTVDDATIGSGLTNDDPVEILDAGGQALDSFSFPTDPGDGVSIEKVRLTGGDREGNWLRSCADSGSTPGLKNCSDPNPVGGGNVLGEPCPNGAFDCASSLCLVNLFSGDAFCGQGCDDAEECPELFQCVDVATAAGPLGACVAEAEFREQNGQVGSPCPGGAADCFSDRCLENPRTRLNFCTDRCLEHNECPQSMLCVNIGGFLEFDPVCVPLGLIRDGLTGDPCLNGPVDCVSLLCLTPVEGAPYCTAYCAENACPPDFDCVDVGGEDVCVEGN